MMQVFKFILMRWLPLIFEDIHILKCCDHRNKVWFLYQGRLTCVPKYQSLRTDVLNEQTCAISNDTLAIKDRKDEKGTLIQSLCHNYPTLEIILFLIFYMSPWFLFSNSLVWNSDRQTCRKWTTTAAHGKLKFKVLSLNFKNNYDWSIGLHLTTILSFCRGSLKLWRLPWVSVVPLMTGNWPSLIKTEIFTLHLSSTLVQQKSLSNLVRR